MNAITQFVRQVIQPTVYVQADVPAYASTNPCQVVTQCNYHDNYYGDQQCRSTCR